MAVSEHTVFSNERFDVEIDFGTFPLLWRSGRFALTLQNRSKEAPAVYALNLDGNPGAETGLGFPERNIVPGIRHLPFRIRDSVL